MSERITLSHGNGGKYMRRLINDLFFKYLANDFLSTETDAARLHSSEQAIMTTVDSFTVQPVIFPGGDIGSLSIHGTVNDLAVSGAVAKYLTLAVIIEEGLALKTLEQIIQSMARAAKEADVKIVCGDTKVVPRGQASEIFITTTGIGYQYKQLAYSTSNIKPGDKILISGTVGDHGAAVMLARGQFGLNGKLQSDSACVAQLCQSIYDIDGVRFLRDPTRGGLATVLHEIAEASGMGIELDEEGIPLHSEVNAICEILGYEPWFLANEGRVVAIVAAQEAETILMQWREMPGGEQSAIIGEIINTHQYLVLKTELGGERIINELADEPLPRIC